MKSTSTISPIGLIQTHATKEGASLLRSIEMTTRVLMGMMEEAHGGKWRFKLDHDAELIMIVPCIEKPIDKPKRGELA